MNLAPVVTFAVYVIIAIFWKHDTLIITKAFTSLSLIGLLTSPVIMFIQFLPEVVQSLACFDRIQSFCNYNSVYTSAGEERVESNSQSGSEIRLGALVPNITNKPASASQKHVALFNGNSFGWKEGRPVLHDLTVGIPRDAVTVVVGAVGSGKSSFLSAVLGDLISMSSGTAHGLEIPAEELGKTRMAYCSQTCWLQNGTIRHNILGIKAYDHSWYQTVTFACGLDADLRSLPKGDSSMVGSKGVNLSGGQKQRIVREHRDLYQRFTNNP